jgi:hypothetical protein
LATTPFTSSVTAIATAAGGGTTHLTDHNNIKSVLTAYDNYISSPSGIFNRIQIAAADGNITGADATSQSASAMFSNNPYVSTNSETILSIQSTASNVSQRVNFRIYGGAGIGTPSTVWSIGSIGGGSNPSFQIQRSASGTYIDSPLYISNTNGVTIVQNGSQFTSGSLTSIPPIQITSSSNVLTTPAVGSLEFDSRALSFTTNTAASSRGPIAVNLFTSNTGTTTLSNVATAQNIFPSTNQTINLAANTTYEMEMWFSISTTGATSNLLSLGFAITGTLTIGYMVHVSQNANTAATITAASSLWIATNTSTAITPAVATSTARQVFVKGLVRSVTAGTFIPQITYSAAPGAAPTIAPNAYIKLVPLASDTTLSSTAWHA